MLNEFLGHMIHGIGQHVSAMLQGMPVDVVENQGTADAKPTKTNMGQLLQNLTDEMSYTNFIRERELQLLYGDEALDPVESEEEETDLLIDLRAQRKRLWKRKK